MEELPERVHRFANRMMGYKPRIDPRKSETPIFATFQDRLFASSIDMGILYLVFGDLFNWISAKTYNGLEQQIAAPMPPELQGTPPEDQIRYFVNRLFDSGFVDLWILNSFYQSLIVGVVLIASWVWFNATPGKFVLGLRFAGREGEGTPDFQAYLKRYAGFYLSMPFFMLGFALLAFDKKKRAWHDRLAGTTVIYTKEGTIFRRGWDLLKKLIRRWMEK